ncbi:MAG: hypothetical protein J2P37_17900 [Ktedonobacteraceae bacterium]|nr:hypothetical protein [Ktedonobacteraceae bacterium]
MSRRSVTQKPQRWDTMDIMRAILVVGAVITTVLSITLYAFTKEAALLQTGSISGMGLAIILPYYFSKDK